MMTQLFRRILVPHDFSDDATRALKVAAGLAARNRGRLTVLHVITPIYPVVGLADMGEVAWIPPQELVADARRRLEKLVARTVSRRRVPGVACRVVVGDPYHAIVEAARGSDSIVMATLGRTGLSHLVIGSVAEKVVRHAPVPVLTVRSAAGLRTPARRRGAPRPSKRIVARRRSRV